MILLADFKDAQMPNYAKTNDFAEKQSTDFCSAWAKNLAWLGRPGCVGVDWVAKEETCDCFPWSEMRYSQLPKNSANCHFPNGI
jgi:hypothetical protein